MNLIFCFENVGANHLRPTLSILLRVAYQFKRVLRGSWRAKLDGILGALLLIVGRIESEDMKYISCMRLGGAEPREEEMAVDAGERESVVPYQPNRWES